MFNCCLSSAQNHHMAFHLMQCKVQVHHSLPKPNMVLLPDLSDHLTTALTGPTAATPAFLPFLQYARHTPASGILHLLFLPCGTFFPQGSTQHTPLSPQALLKWHLLRKSFPDPYSIYHSPPPTLFAFPDLLSTSLSPSNIILHICNADITLHMYPYVIYHVFPSLECKLPGGRNFCLFYSGWYLEECFWHIEKFSGNLGDGAFLEYCGGCTNTALEVPLWSM